jgi:hypothetical protein
MSRPHSGRLQRFTYTLPLARAEITQIVEVTLLLVRYSDRHQVLQYGWLDWVCLRDPESNTPGEAIEAKVRMRREPGWMSTAKLKSLHCIAAKPLMFES